MLRLSSDLCTNMHRYGHACVIKNLKMILKKCIVLLGKDLGEEVRTWEKSREINL